MLHSPDSINLGARNLENLRRSHRWRGMLLGLTACTAIGCASTSQPSSSTNASAPVTANPPPSDSTGPAAAVGTTVVDNFERPNGGLGSNWTVVSDIGGSDGGIQLLNNAFAPTSDSQTAFPTSVGTWAGGQTFGPNQYARVQIRAIAPQQSVLAITGAMKLGRNTSYTYTLTSGQTLQTPQPVNIAGMTDGGNNGAYVISALDTGTFTVSNPNGVTATAQNGIGISATDSLCGPAVRSTAGILNGYFAYIGNNSGYVAMNNGDTDGRVYVYELWKFVNGDPEEIQQILTTSTIPDSVGDIFYLFALGNKVALYKNSMVLAADVDHSLLAGTPGLIASSAQGAGNKMPLGSNIGVSGMQMTNWVGSDAPSTPSGWVERAAETFMIAGPAPNPPWSQTAALTAVPNFAGPGGGNAGEVDFAGTGSLVYSGRTWAGDQSSSVVMSNVSQYTSIDVLVRAATASETFYLGQFIFTNGLGTGIFNLEKFIDGTPTMLATAPGTVNFADVLRLEAVGTRVTFKQNGTAILSASDSSITSGSPGITSGGGVNIMFWEGDEVLP